MPDATTGMPRRRLPNAARPLWPQGQTRFVGGLRVSVGSARADREARLRPLAGACQAKTVTNSIDNRAGKVDLDALVDGWLSLPEVADELGVTPNKVRQLARERQLAALRRPGVREPAVPAAFVMQGTIVKGLPGTLTVLADHGLPDDEAVEWLFTADESLPGRPIDALREDRGKEVRRRAQAII